MGKIVLDLKFVSGLQLLQEFPLIKVRLSDLESQFENVVEEYDVTFPYIRILRQT